MSAPSSRDMFNDWYHDEQWTPVTLRPDAATTNRLDGMARLLRGERGRLLDLGCGNGGFLLALADQFDQLTGVDIADVRIAAADNARRTRYPQHAEKVRFVVCASGQPLPFSDASFDVLTAAVVLEFVDDIFEVRDEAARVCAPGGCFVISAANFCYVRNVWKLLRGRVPMISSMRCDISYLREHHWDGGARRYFSKSLLGDLLRASGFEPERWTTDGYLSKYRRFMTNLSGTLCVRARRK